MTLNAVIAFSLRFSPNSTDFQADFITVVEDRPIMSVKYCLLVPVAPKLLKGGLKTQNGRFPSKIALCLKKVFYKVSLCENCQRQSCKAFIGLPIGAKMIGEGRPLVRENLADTDPPLATHRFSIYTMSQKIPDVFSYNSRKHCRILIIFGRNITEKVSNQKMLYFSTSHK